MTSSGLLTDHSTTDYYQFMCSAYWTDVYVYHNVHNLHHLSNNAS